MLARFLLQTGLALGLGLFFVPTVRAQDDDKQKKALQELIQKAEDEYRQFFKRPENAIQFWAAIKFEMDTGKSDLAAFHLHELLKLPPEKADPELIKIEKAEGMNAFLRLQNVKDWSKNDKLQKEAENDVQTLIGRVSKALETHLSNPQRIQKFIKQLDAPTTEERTFAFAELQRSREKAVPYLVQALRTSFGTPMNSRLQEAMVRLDPDIVPPLLQILRAADAKDALDIDLRPAILNILSKRADKRAIPYLWHLSEAAQYPEKVRDRARALLSQLTDTKLVDLPPAKIALTELAEKYFQHKVKFKSEKFNSDLTTGARIWPWDGQKLALEPIELGPAAAEKYFGLRFAKEALDLDPSHLPAQRLLLGLTLERGFNTKVDEFLLKPISADYHKLLATIDPELLAQVLERALDEGNVPIILPAVQALGDRGHERAARLGTGGSPRGLLRALYYPDRRVQIVALRALLKMPNHAGPAASMRMVDLLRRFSAAESTPKALLAYVPDDQAAEARKAIKELGFQPVLVKNLRSAFEKLQASADFDVLLIGSAFPEKELPYILTQLRGDVDHGRLPLVVFTGKDKEESVSRQVNRQAMVKVLPDAFLTNGEDLKGALEIFLQDGLMPLTKAERKEMSRLAMDVLNRMARGEISGHDVRPAKDAVMGALRSPELAVDAVEILGRLPGRDIQTRLADLTLDPGKEKLRVAAAMELNRSVQKFGLLLEKHQVQSLKEEFSKAKVDSPLRTQLALFMGHLRTNASATGQQLIQFSPDPPPPPKKEKEKEKDKDNN